MTDMSTHSSTTTPPQDLSFPAVRVDRSLHSIDLDDLAMRSNTRRYPEHASSSLEDSTYEVLGDSLYDTSDDEGRTESLASTDHTPDDVSSVADTDEFDDDEEYLDDASQQVPAPLAGSTGDVYDAHTRAGPVEDSMMSSRADTQVGQASHIDIEEIPSVVNGRLDGCGVIRHFEPREVPDVLRLYKSPEVRITVKLALSDSSLSVSRPFRIMYVGQVPLWAKEDVNGHIAAALTADSKPTSLDSSNSSQSSRFSVVRVPSFPEGVSSSKVQLIDLSGVEMVVNQCTHVCKLATDSEKPHYTQITLNDGTKLIFGPGKSLQVVGEPGAALPDLAVFCHNTVQPSANSPHDIEQFHMVREAFKRHSIPSLDIATVRPFHDCPEAFSFDEESLRTCVEGRKSPRTSFEVLETLPIDIYSFLELQPAQLNRHLSYITKDLADAPFSFHASAGNALAGPVEGKKEANKRSVREVIASVKKNPYAIFALKTLKQPSFWIAVVLLVGAITAHLLTTGTVTVPWSVGHAQQAVQAPAEIFTPAISPSPAKVTVSTSESSTPPSPISVVGPSSELSVPTSEKSLGKPQVQTAAPKQNTSERFEISVSGDDQFVLTPPKYIARAKRAPQVLVQVHQDSREIPIRISRSANSVYTVTLEQEQPRGEFEVKIVTRSKPLLTQTFNVSLGSQMTMLSTLFDHMGRLSHNVKEDMAVAQLNLKSVSTQLTKGLQAGLVRLEGGASSTFGSSKYWKRHVQESTESVAEHLQAAREEASRQWSVATSLTKDVSKHLQRNWQQCTSRSSGLFHAIQRERLDLWEQSAPIRKSHAVLGARENALRLWRKLDGSATVAKASKKGKKRMGRKEGRRKARHH